MTKIVSLVRLIPGQVGSAGAQSYVAQYRLPAHGEKWITAGRLSLDEKRVIWEAAPGEELGFPDVEVDIRDLIDSGSRSDPRLFARYKIGKYANGVLEGEWPLGEVIPPGLAGEG